MFKVFIEIRAKEKIDYLKDYDVKNHELVFDAIKDIQQFGNKSSQLKPIGDDIFRKRVGRWRILFTFEKDNMIKVWIIELEKDTKKDYKRWKDYIVSKKRYG